MTTLMRILRKPSRWPGDEDLSWVPTGEIPADPLSCLLADNNAWSVYQVDDNRERVNRVIAALAAGRETEAIAEYLIFDSALVDQAGIPIETTPGQTPDNEVNLWHLDISHMTASRLARLATLLVLNCEPKPCLGKEVTRLIANSVVQGYIPAERVRYGGTSRTKLEIEIAQRRSGNPN